MTTALETKWEQEEQALRDNPPRLSLCMIVKNEEALLARCLDSVVGLVDEICVLDTGSTDRTVEIAASFGAKIGHFEWCDDFAAARNASLDLATGDWIIYLDGDECLFPHQHDQIRALIRNGKAKAYSFSIRNYFVSGNSSTFDVGAKKNDTGHFEEYGYYNDFLALRMFKKGPKFCNRIHELPQIDIFEQHPEIIINHRGKALPGEKAATKREYYLRLAKEEVEAHPFNTQMLFSLAGEAFVMEEWDTALDASTRYIKLLPNNVPVVIMLIAAAAYQAKGDHVRALSILEQILGQTPDHPFALVIASRSLYDTGHEEVALGLINRAIALAPDFSAGVLTKMKMLERKSDRAEAFLTVLRALQHNPHDQELLKQLNWID
jgi:tetratricopeptide (TPR) repeat protein